MRMIAAVHGTINGTAIFNAQLRATESLWR
jgi:hypothetical protein